MTGAATQDIKKQIREFVMGNLAPRKGVGALADDESLLESGVVDSLGIFQLVAFLEETFNVRIADEEITDRHFETIDAIEAFVGPKLR